MDYYAFIHTAKILFTLKNLYLDGALWEALV